jgi:hypothetical protein
LVAILVVLAEITHALIGVRSVVLDYVHPTRTGALCRHGLSIDLRSLAEIGGRTDSSVYRVAPDVVNELATADDSGNYGTGVNADAHIPSGKIKAFAPTIDQCHFGPHLKSGETVYRICPIDFRCSAHKHIRIANRLQHFEPISLRDVFVPGFI